MGSSESREVSRAENGSETDREMEEKRKEALRSLAVGAGLLIAAWGISKLFGGVSESESTNQRKMMKAPGRDYQIYRDEFERDPSDYFRRLRDY